MAKNTPKKEDYRSLDDQALKDRINEESFRLKKMKFAHAINPIENPMAIRASRRMIARLKTELRCRSLQNPNK